jgi:flagellar motility protein MotE (MotC chaperone)
MSRAFRILPLLLVAMLVMTGLQGLKLWTGFTAIGAAHAGDADAAKPAAPAPAAANGATPSAPPTDQSPAGVSGSTGAAATTPITPDPTGLGPSAEAKDTNIPALAASENAAPAPVATAENQPAPQAVTKPARPKIPGEEDFTSASEIEVLSSLTKRREDLDKRQAELDMREKLLMATEQRLDQKLAEIKSIQGEVQAAVGTLNDKQTKEIASLVKVYENMKPKDAAAIMQDLDRSILLEVCSRIKEAKMAPILAAMEPSKAREITVLLAKRNEVPGQNG